MSAQVIRHSIGVSVGVVLFSQVLLSGAGARAETPPDWYNCRTREVFTPAKRVWCDRWQVLQNATYTVPTSLEPNAPHTQVKLQNGRYQRPDGKFFVELVNERGWMAFGNLNQDGRPDAVVVLGVALDRNGKSVGTYLSAVLDVGGKSQSIVPIRLGERVMLNGPITISNGSVTVPLLTQTKVIDRVYVIDQTLRERF